MKLRYHGYTGNVLPDMSQVILEHGSWQGQTSPGELAPLAFRQRKTFPFGEQIQERREERRGWVVEEGTGNNRGRRSFWSLAAGNYTVQE
jgi:hypothetical protein